MVPWPSPSSLVAPVCVLAAMAALTVADLMDAETGRPALLVTLLIVGAGAAYAQLLTRRALAVSPSV